MPATDPPSEDAADLFRDTWRIYRKILDGNYMFHREINAAVAGALGTRAAAGPLAVLELGCGDGSQSRAALGRLPMSVYHGCDLSAPALALAAETLAGIAGAVNLECADLVEFLARNTCRDDGVRRYDVVYSSFVVHHLDGAAKQRFFELGRQALNDGGLLVLVDVLRDDRQDLDTYLDAYLDRARRDWLALEDAEYAALERHIRACDQPETVAALAAMAGQAGFGAPRSLAHHTWHGALAFQPI